MLTMAKRKKPPELPPDLVLVRVDNPYRYDGAPQKTDAVASTRDDPLRGMLARGQIGTHQFEAGRLWQKYREQSEIGLLKAIDTTKEPVDGGGCLLEPITDRHRKAVDALNEARRYLGSYGADLIESVLARRLSIAQASAERKMVSVRGRDYIGRRFGECLEALAKLWGLAS